ncbi:MAG: Rubrerythrin [Herminiimonas sp.]|nr:Rubrerythrin [Herminiimonas sp.]
MAFMLITTPKGNTMANQTAVKSVTIENLEAAFAGESMAHIKYRYFAKLAREAGAEDVAKIFENTADQEVMHAFGHLDLLYPKAKMTPARALEIAIEGETYEYTEMYPRFRHLAIEEGNNAAVSEFDEQIAESKEHAAAFQRTLELAGKRFAALAKVEERHANNYRATLAGLDKAA